MSQDGGKAAQQAAGRGSKLVCGAVRLVGAAQRSASDRTRSRTQRRRGAAAGASSLKTSRHTCAPALQASRAGF